jgi:glycosyltransferase involved in cell wall biosynthesis
MKRLFGSQNLKSLLINQFLFANGIMAYPSYYNSLKSLNNNVFLHNPKLDLKGFENCPDFEKPEEIKRKKLITFLGKISETKGAFDLLKAYEQIGESKEFSLIYVGEGKKKEELKCLIKDKKLKNVHVYSSIPPWRVPGLLRSSNVFFVGERNFYVERHFSRKPMEALACRAPLIISSEMKEKGIYRNLINGVHCIDVNPLNTDNLADKLTLILDNDSISSKLSQEGYEFAQRCNENFNDYINGVENFLRNTA